jgi:hypothetical protein
MTKPDRSDLETRGRLRPKAVSVATSVLNGRTGIIQGARELATIGHVLVDNWALDPDFVVFGGVASESDDLPVGKDRERWDPTALVDKDAEVQDYETRVRSTMYKACRNVIRRFTDV